MSDLQTLVPVANQFAASTPDLLKILANQTTTASTITSLAPEVDQAISGGEELAGRTADLLSAIQEPYAVLAADSGPFLNAISANPQEISQLLGGLDAWARAWGAAEASGPYLQITQDQVVVNAADLGLAVVGGPQAAAYLGAGLGPGTVNPPTYNSPGSLSATGSSPSPVLVSEPVMSAADQTAAVARIVHAVSGRAPRSPAVADPAPVAGAPEPGEWTMRAHHHHPGLRLTFVKVMAFTALSLLVTSIVIASLLDINGQAATGYLADFSNASGLQPGDTVRIAGVEVGKVSSVTLDNDHAVVSFSVDDSQPVTSTTRAAIHFENLLGQRFLALLAGRPGGTAPAARRRDPRAALDAGSRPHRSVRRFPAAVLRPFALPGQPAGRFDHRRLPGRVGDHGQPRRPDRGADEQPGGPAAGDRHPPQQLVEPPRRRRVTRHAARPARRQLRQPHDRARRVTCAAGLRHRQPGVGGDGHQRDPVSFAAQRSTRTSRRLAGAVRSLSANQQGIDGVLTGLPGLLGTLTKVQSTGNWINVYLCNLTLNVNGQLNVSLVPGVSPVGLYPNPVTLPSGPFGDQSLRTGSCS